MYTIYVSVRVYIYICRPSSTCTHIETYMCNMHIYTVSHAPDTSAADTFQSFNQSRIDSFFNLRKVYAHVCIKCIFVVCLYVCVLCTYWFIYKDLYIYVCIWEWLLIVNLKRSKICICIYAYIYIPTYVHTYIHTRTQTCVYAYAYICIHICIYVSYVFIFLFHPKDLTISHSHTDKILFYKGGVYLGTH